MGNVPMECPVLLQHNGEDLLLLPESDMASCMQTEHSTTTTKIPPEAGHEGHGPNLEGYPHSRPRGHMQYTSPRTGVAKTGSRTVHKNKTISHHWKSITHAPHWGLNSTPSFPPPHARNRLKMECHCLFIEIWYWSGYFDSWSSYSNPFFCVLSPPNIIFLFWTLPFINVCFQLNS